VWGWMINFRFFIVQSLDRVMHFFLSKFQILLGYNSSDIRPRHLQQILTLANIEVRKLNVIDGGANVGEFTDLILRHHFHSKVLCIEPQESLVKLLQEKYLGRNVECFEVGLGTTNGNAKLYFSGDGDRKASLGNQRENLMSRNVPILTLANVLELSKMESFDILKLDLEGMDVPVLAEFFRTKDSKLPKVIILETSYLAHQFGFTSRKTFQLLYDQGYLRIFRTSPILGLIPISLRDVRDFEGHTVNWIAIRS